MAKEIKIDTTKANEKVLDFKKEYERLVGIVESQYKLRLYALDKNYPVHAAELCWQQFKKANNI